MNKERLKRLLVGKFSLRRCIRALVLVYLCVAAYVFLVSNRMIFPAQTATYTDSQDIVKIATRDGVLLSAIHLVNTNAPFTVLYSHGNAEDLGDLRPVLEQYRRHGFSILAYDYQGYGTSEGRPTEANTYQDIEAVYRYLTETKHIPADCIVAHGRSVGAGPATYLAMQKPLAGLILESPFVSAFRVVSPVPLLPFDRFPNLRRIRRVTCPVLILHGTADTTIPIWHGKRLFAAANQPKQCQWIEGAGHDDICWSGDRYWGGILSFADTLARQSGEHATGDAR